MDARAQRFACTQCGKCCNRSPEVELSEAAALADVFVFRLMFRIYILPAKPNGGASEAFYQRKRLLSECSVQKSTRKMKGRGKTAEQFQYLMISALTLDSGSGGCGALRSGKCSIYDRRPFACRTAPFHYSRAEASAGTYLEEFVRTPGYRCDTGESAPVVIERGRIINSGIQQARIEALAILDRDKRWHKEILRRMRRPAWNDAGLPSLPDVEANAAFGATTTSMRLAWQIAAEAGMIGGEEAVRLIAAQAAAIDRELANRPWAEEARQTLLDMRAEYGGA